MSDSNRVTKPTYFDKNNDKKLLEWLKTKGSYASYVRFLLNEVYMREQGKQSIMFQPQIQMQNTEQEHIDDNKDTATDNNKAFMNNMVNLAKRMNKNNKHTDEG